MSESALADLKRGLGIISITLHIFCDRYRNTVQCCTWRVKEEDGKILRGAYSNKDRRSTTKDCENQETSESWLRLQTGLRINRIPINKHQLTQYGVINRNSGRKIISNPVIHARGRPFCRPVGLGSGEDEHRGQSCDVKLVSVNCRAGYKYLLAARRKEGVPINGLFG